MPRSTPSSALAGISPEQLKLIAAILNPQASEDEAAKPANTRANRKAATAVEVWTCRKAWKGQKPSQGLLWAAMEEGLLRFVIGGKVVEATDKLALSQAIGKARGHKVEVS